jgi:protocatechuate 3,4-dioxygenase beta subunit
MVVMGNGRVATRWRGHALRGAQFAKDLNMEVQGDHDTRQPRVRNRRDVLGLIGAAGAALLAGCTAESPQPGASQTASANRGGNTAANTTPANAGAAGTSMPACVLTPQQTEGPYFVDERLNRSDIRSDPSDGSVREGVPLRLTLSVFEVTGNSCTPLVGAFVDVWHCDALGVYSDTRDANFGSTLGKKFLRGYQQTDATGSVTFATIYPGFYGGRAVHIHFKVRKELGNQRGSELTSQLYFDDAVSDQVFTQNPYSRTRGNRLRNNADGAFRSNGDQLILNAVRDGQGYTASFNVGMRAA